MYIIRTHRPRPERERADKRKWKEINYSPGISKIITFCRLLRRSIQSIPFNLSSKETAVVVLMLLLLASVFWCLLFLLPITRAIFRQAGRTTPQLGFTVCHVNSIYLSVLMKLNLLKNLRAEFDLWFLLLPFLDYCPRFGLRNTFLSETH